MHAAASFSTLNVSSQSSSSRRSAYAASVARRCGPKPGAGAGACPAVVVVGNHTLPLAFVLALAVASVLALAWASVCHAPHISTSASWQPTLPGARAQRLVHKQARRACWHNEAGLEPPRAPAHTWRHRFPSFARLLPIQQTHMYSTDAGGKTAVLMCSPVRRHARLATSHRLLEPGPVSHLTNEHGRGAHPGPTRVRSRARRRC